ncbi:hypothetical protein SAMN04488688_10874 [Paenibacillus sp. cl141a]|uniref:DUF6886 family protein n=1 Tax=Paenibacillus sp. cl141a TaxID=1761877 RepID=UPI0008D01B8E|nr:DUF6886 family protein [Paenibacillus sp. cl141a]SEM04455.1 hypothetical protein SAMN04488688_10874 [Paenibacillus sp. cl141a]
MLFHYSEDANIEIFIPKEKQNRPDFPAVVWAIDEEHEFTYYFPRDCPRIICRKTEDISDKNNDLFFNNTNADIIVTVESEWYARIIEQSLYKYHFKDDGFELFDKTAGYYISYQVVKPIGIEKVDKLVERLISKGIELRFTSNLYPLREAILTSDFKGFGIHRFNNAKKL